MPNNYFISGMPKSGKTTLLRKLVEKMRERGLKVGGFLSPDEKRHGARVGFAVQDIETGRVETLATMDADGPKVAKYHVDIRSFEDIALPILEKSDSYDVIVIDEIGRMEMKSMKFGEMLADLLESDTPLVASLHRDYIEDYGAWGEVQILTPSNRGEVYLNLLAKIAEYTRKLPKGPAKPIVRRYAGPAKKGKQERKKAGKKAAAKRKEKPAKKKGKAAKQAKKKEQPSKAGKEKKGKHEDLEKMAEDILGHREKKHEREEKKEEKAEEKEEKKEEYEVEEKTEEEKREEKEEQRKRDAFRDWVKEHIGV